MELPSTASDGKPHAWLKEACDAAIRGDISKICASFGCDVNQSSSGLDDFLVCSPTRVKEVLDNLFSSWSSTLTTTIHPQHALRALLLIPSSYEAPWLAACKVVETSLHQKFGCLGNLIALDDKAPLSLVTEIQSFFHQTVAVWWEHERRLTSGHALKFNATSAITEQFSNTTPRQMLLRLAKIVMAPLRSPFDLSESCIRDNRRWTMPLELLATIASLFRDLEEPCDQSLVSSILDMVFDDNLQPSWLLPWMTVVSDLRHNLRLADWSRLRDLICLSLTAQQPKSMSIDVSDLPGLAKAIVTLVSTSDDKESTYNDDVQQIWQRLILHILCLASSNDATFSTVETVLQSSFATLQPIVLRNWLPQVENSETDEQPAIPNWIKVHLILLVSQASRQSGSQLISNLVAKALGVNGEDSNVSKQCWSKLLALALPKPPSTTTLQVRRCKRVYVKGVVHKVQKQLEGVSYNSRGQLVQQLAGNKEETIKYLSQAATLLRESIFLGSASNRAQRPSYHIFFAERAQWWVNAANEAVLQQCEKGSWNGNSSEFDMYLAIIVLVVVYCEIPTSRSVVVRSMLKSISSDENKSTDETPRLLYCTIISIIVRSLSRNKNAASAAGLSALNPVTDAFAKHIPIRIFCPLADALSPLPSTRFSLLSFARKCLDDASWGCDHHVWWADEGKSERRDRVECGFYTLCTLLRSLNDECSLEAWRMLSDFIVLRRPSLPCAARSLLFRCLLNFAEQKRFNVAFCKHLLRACLVTLCTYCSDSNGHLEFIPECAFSSWVDSKAASKSRIVQQEDLAALLRLACGLLRTSCQDDEMERQTFERERVSLLQSILNFRDDEISHRFSCSKLDDKETITSLGTMCVVHSLLKNITKDGTSGTDAKVGVQNSISIALVDKLLEAERDELNSLGLDWTSEDQVPTWLGQVSLTTGMRQHSGFVDPPLLATLQSAFCDLLLEVVLNSAWPARDAVSVERSREDELRNKVMACGWIVSQKIKRKKMTATVGELHVAKAFDDEAVCSAAKLCLALSAQFLKSAVSSKENLKNTKTAFDLALEICEAIQGMKVDPEHISQGNRIDVHDLFHSIWGLYLVVGTEACSRRFIEYFEESCAKQTLSFSTNARLCFERVETTDDVDNIMRTMRTSILHALSHCSSIISMNPQLALTSRSGIHVDLLSSVLVVLCNDLRSGLDGMSGGVTNQSFMAYVDSIEEISGLIYDNIQALMKIDFSNSILSGCRQASLSIEDILCAFPLRGAVLFKRSLRLALIKLPSLARSNDRAQELGFIDSSLTSGERFWTTYGFANNVFVQCMRVLARWAADGMNTTTPWFEIAGPEHCSSTVDDVNFTAASNTLQHMNPTSNDDVPVVIAIPNDCKPTTIETTSPTKGGYIQLPSKECWSWACLCAISAMEHNWMESSKVFMRMNATPSKRSTINWAGFLVARREDLGSIFQTIRLAFQQIEMATGPGEAKFTKSGLEIVSAIFMPGSTKVRLYTLLGRITVVLRRSVKIIQAFIRGSSAATYDDDASIFNLGTVEALSCLCAWLNDNADDSDFTILTKLWYRSEKKIHEASHKMTALPRGDDFVLRSFPKLLCRVEELETATQTLHELIGSLKENNSRENIRALDVLLKSSWEPSWDYDANEKDITIRSLIKTKVKAFSSSTSLDIEGVDVKEPASKRKKRSKEASRVHHRHVKRSRNGLVDKWLQLDQDIEDEGEDDDAYVELEDFLVDG